MDKFSPSIFKTDLNGFDIAFILVLRYQLDIQKYHLHLIKLQILASLISKK